MTSSPLNVVHLNDAIIVHIARENEADADAANDLEDLQSFLEMAKATLHRFTDNGSPPWDQVEIVDLVKSRTGRQFIILCECATSFIVTLTIMALEQGYDAFVVCNRYDGQDEFSISRLENAGATLMLFDRFLMECSYRAAKDNE